MNIEKLNKELVKDGYLKQIIYFEELDSTNNFAKKNELTDDTLIVTSNQTNGVGRFNRQWISSPNKDLTFTITKAITIGIDEIHLINFYSSYILYLTLTDVLSKYTKPEIFLKWPNDIIFNKKKLPEFY